MTTSTLRVVGSATASLLLLAGCLGAPAPATESATEPPASASAEPDEPSPADPTSAEPTPDEPSPSEPAADEIDWSEGTLTVEEPYGFLHHPAQYDLGVGDTITVVWRHTEQDVEKTVARWTLNSVTADPMPEPDREGREQFFVRFSITIEAVEDYPIGSTDISLFDLADGSHRSGMVAYQSDPPAPDELPLNTYLTAGQVVTGTVTFTTPFTAGTFGLHPISQWVGSWKYSAVRTG